MRTIRGLNSITYLQNTDLLNEILKKVPSSMLSTHATYANSTINDKTHLKKLAGFFFEQSQTFIQMEIIIAKTKSSSRNEHSSRDRRPNEERDTVLTANVGNTNDPATERKDFKTNLLCVYCKRQNHRVDNCREFAKIPVFQRWKFARGQRMCYKCLKIVPCTRINCDSNSVCKHCKENHHTLLHDDFNKNQNTKQDNTLSQRRNVETVNFVRDPNL